MNRVTEQAYPHLLLRPRTFVPLILILAVIIHLVLPRLGVLDQSLHVLWSMSVVNIAWAVAAQVLSYAANGALLRAIVRSSRERISLGRATAIVMAASTVCLVAGGLVGYSAAVYQWSRQSGLSRETSAVGAWLPSVFDGGMLVVVASLSALELLRGQRLPRSALSALIVVMTLLLSVIATSFYAIARPSRLAALLRTLQKVPLMRRLARTDHDSLQRKLSTVSAALRRRSGLEAAVAAGLNLAFDMLTLELLFIGAGHPVSPSILIAGYGVPLLLGRFSFLPGGIAVVEIGMTALYAALGVPLHLAVVVILMYRFISFWIPTLAGVPVAVTLQMKREEKN